MFFFFRTGMEDFTLMSITQVKDIVREVREEFELGKIDYQVLAPLYVDYRNGGDVELFLRRAIVFFPAGNSGLASVYLRSVLGGEVMQGWYREHVHTFLVLEDRIVVDITADQFGGPEVYVGPLRCPYFKRRERMGTV